MQPYCLNSLILTIARSPHIFYLHFSCTAKIFQLRKKLVCLLIKLWCRLRISCTFLMSHTWNQPKETQTQKKLHKKFQVCPSPYHFWTFSLLIERLRIWSKKCYIWFLTLYIIFLSMFLISCVYENTCCLEYTTKNFYV